MGMGNFEGEEAFRCIGHSVVTCVKTAEPVELLLGMWTRVGPRDHVLDGVQIPMGRGNFEKGEEAAVCKV